MSSQQLRVAPLGDEFLVPFSIKKVQEGTVIDD